MSIDTRRAVMVMLNKVPTDFLRIISKIVIIKTGPISPTVLSNRNVRAELNKTTVMTGPDTTFPIFHKYYVKPNPIMRDTVYPTSQFLFIFFSAMHQA